MDTRWNQGNGTRIKTYQRRLAAKRALLKMVRGMDIFAQRKDHRFWSANGLDGGSCSHHKFGAVPCGLTRYYHEGISWRLLWHLGMVG